MENDYTISCHVSQIRCKYSLRSREAHGFLFKELSKEIDVEQILMIQLIPSDWPQRMKVTLRSKEVKDEILVQGLPLYGTTISMKDEDSSIIKVTLQNLLAGIKHSDIMVEMSKYGDALRIEHEFIYAEGYKTNAVTGTRFVYMSSIATRIPSTIQIKPDEASPAAVAKVIYRARQIIPQDEAGNVAPVNAPTGKSDRSCYACGKTDHISTTCPDNKGCKQTDDVFLMYSSKCPLHVMNTEYPFKVDGNEYICIEQFVQNAKCLHFGDQRLAAQVCDETDPKIMRRIGEKIPGYVNSEWIPHMPRILGEAIYAKFHDSRAAGARDMLLETGDRVIGEATRNMKYGTGIHVSDSNAADRSKWEGENLMGEFLMMARDEILADKQEQERATNTEHSIEADHTGETTENDESDDDSYETHEGSYETHDESFEQDSNPLNIISPEVQEIQQLADSPSQSPTRYVVVIGDENAADLPLSGNYGDNDTPHIVKSYNTCDKAIRSVVKEIKSDSIVNDIDKVKVDSVALHVGSHDWSTGTENIPTAKSIFSEYQRLLNSVCLHFHDPQIVVSSIPFRRLCENLTDAVNEEYVSINTEISKLNQMLHALSKEESNIHFVKNDASIYTTPLFESLYETPIILNEKGKHILADNLRGGISAAFAQDMHNIGLPEYKEVTNRRSSSS